MQRTLFGRLGSFAARRRWWVIGAWAVLLVAMGAFAPGLPKRLSPGGFEVPGSEGLAVQQMLSTRFTQQFASTAVVVVSNPGATAESPAFAGFVQRLSGDLQATEGVAGVVSFYSTGAPAFVSANRRTTYLIVGLSGDQNQWLETSAALVEKAAEASRRDGGGTAGYDVVAGGQGPFFNRLSEVSKHDIEVAELFAFPVTALVLLLGFGTLVAAGLPLMLGLLSLVVTLGALWFLTHVTQMSIFVTNTASIIGIGVGIDYALFVVTRFREELRYGRDVPEAISAAMATSGRAVALSGATVVVALAGLFLVDIQAFRSMAIGSMSVVAVAVMAAVTFLPAVLAVAGRAVDRFRLPFVTEPGTVSETGFWHRWAMVVMRRPWSALAGSVLVLGVLAAPFFAIRLGYPGPDVLPAQEQPRIASERLAREFGPGVVGPIDMLVDFGRGEAGAAGAGLGGGTGSGSRTGSDGSGRSGSEGGSPGSGGAGGSDGGSAGSATSPQALARIDDLTRRLARDPDVAGVESVTSAFPSLGMAQATLAGGIDTLPPALGAALQSRVNWDKGADLAYVTAIPRVAPESPEAEELVRRIRRDIVPASGLMGQVDVGGTTALNLDLSNAIESRMPLVVAAVLALSFVLLAMAFRSLLLPLKAIVMNLLSVGASYGLIVALFQWGWAEKVMGFTSNGHIEVFVPLFLFSVLFGLSMDYEVFLMSRMREEYARTGSNEQAVARGLEGTARTITSAAAVMVVVFVAFSTSRVLPFKEMGLGLAAAVLIDATLVRTVLVPAAMRLMGDWNWWMPAWLDRLLPRISLEDGGTGSHADPPTLVGHRRL